MQKKVLVLIFLLISATSLFSASKKSNKKIMFVAVEELSIKNKPSITGKKVETLDYGERVFVVDEKGSWYKIKAYDDESIVGWVNSGSLTKKKIIVAAERVSSNASQISLAGKGSVGALRSIDDEEEATPFETKVSTNAAELSLAGKGFNSAIEAAYEEEFEVSFEIVDEIENCKISEDDTIAFISEGNLRLVN